MAILAVATVAQLAACATAPVRASLPARCVEAPTEPKITSTGATVAEGESTLKAERRAYATYFNEMKNKVAAHWRWAEAYQRYDSDLWVDRGKVLITVLEVAVRSDGSLDQVRVYRSSGLDYIDGIAVDAFERAQPLGEPPRELLTKDAGLMYVRFGFVIEKGKSAAGFGEAVPCR